MSIGICNRLQFIYKFCSRQNQTYNLDIDIDKYIDIDNDSDIYTDTEINIMSKDIIFFTICRVSAWLLAYALGIWSSLL